MFNNTVVMIVIIIIITTAIDINNFSNHGCTNLPEAIPTRTQ